MERIQASIRLHACFLITISVSFVKQKNKDYPWESREMHLKYGIFFISNANFLVWLSNLIVKLGLISIHDLLFVNIFSSFVHQTKFKVFLMSCRCKKIHQDWKIAFIQGSEMLIQDRLAFQKSKFRIRFGGHLMTKETLHISLFVHVMAKTCSNELLYASLGSVYQFRGRK